MKWLAIGGVWTGLMVVWAVMLLDSVKGQDAAEIIVLAPMILWILGMVVLAVFALMRAGPRTSGLVCTHCGAAVHDQWRSPAGNYLCPGCGAETVGQPKEERPTA